MCHIVNYVNLTGGLNHREYVRSYPEVWAVGIMVTPYQRNENADCRLRPGADRLSGLPANDRVSRENGFCPPHRGAKPSGEQT